MNTFIVELQFEVGVDEYTVTKSVILGKCIVNDESEIYGKIVEKFGTESLNQISRKYNNDYSTYCSELFYYNIDTLENI